MTTTNGKKPGVLKDTKDDPWPRIVLKTTVNYRGRVFDIEIRDPNIDPLCDFLDEKGLADFASYSSKQH